VKVAVLPSFLCDDNSFLNTGTGGALSECGPEVGVDGVAGGVGAVEPHVEVRLVVPRLVLDTVGRQLISEGPGCPDTLLDVLDEAVAALQTRVVVQRRPDLTANLLKHKPERSIFCIPASQRHGEREF